MGQKSTSIESRKCQLPIKEETTKVGIGPKMEGNPTYQE